MQRMLSKPILLSLLAFSCLIVSCEKNSEPTLAQTIVGKWQLEQLYFVRDVNGKDSSTKMDLQYENNIEYKSDATYSEQSGVDSPTLGNWELEDSALVITTIRSSANYKVMQLDNVQLKLMFFTQGPDNIRFMYFYIRK